MLTSLLGKKQIKRLYKTFHEAMLENIRLIGDTSYAPRLELYEKYKDEVWGKISMELNDKTHYISKPQVPDGDIINFKNAKEDSTGIMLSGNLVINVDNGHGSRSREGPDYEDILSELILLINYGISKLENKLLNVMREIYSDKLIDNRYQVSIKTVNISVNKYAELQVNYSIVIVDEEALRPANEDDVSDDEAGGREYKRIRDETPLSTKKKERK